MKSALALVLLFRMLSSFLNASACSECYFNDEAHRVYACGKNAGNEIALTFDDGPHPEYTLQILDILKEEGVRATFFVIGENVGQHPEILSRIISEGHAVGNHTYAHHRPICQTKDDLYRDLEKNRRLLQSFSVEDRLFRPPGGEYDEKVLSLAAQMDFDIILWTVDTVDWRAPAPEEIVNRVLSNVKSGDIILMHDYVWGKSSTPEALRILLPILKEQGYTFLTVDELIGQGES